MNQPCPPGLYLKDPGGIIVTMLLGIAGSFVGGFLFKLVGIGHGSNTAGLIGSILGALILLAVYRLIVGRGKKEPVA